MGRFDFDAERMALEAATGGKNTLLLDDLGMPSVMVRIPRFRWSDAFEGFPATTCSAFIVNGKELDYIYISKYHNIVENNRGYSLAGRDPAVYMTIDQAREYCANKGKGWHLMTNMEWMAIAHWCRKNSTIPRGNNYCGCDVTNKWECGAESCEWTYASDWNGRSKRKEGENYILTGRVLTGSGPNTWSHDWTPAGIFDLNGNVWDFVAGMRLKNGEIQIIEENNSAANVNETATSSLWKAINTSGALVAPGSANTFKYDGVNAGNAQEASNSVSGGVILNTTISKPQYTGGATDLDFGYTNMTLQTMAATAGVTPHLLLKQYGFYPPDVNMDSDNLWVRNYGERVPLRGGDWYNGLSAGLFALDLNRSRSLVSSGVGFRAAFVDL